MSGVAAANGPSMMPAEASGREASLSMWRYFVRAMTSRYAAFSGRARRKEYWAFALIWILILVAMVLLALALGEDARATENAEPSTAAMIASFTMGLFVLISLIPMVTVTVRRLHDLNMSGWWVLLLAVPGIGSAASIVIGFIPGHPGPNRFGPSPIPAR